MIAGRALLPDEALVLEDELEPDDEVDVSVVTAETGS